MPVSISGFSHARLTVTDITRSRAFYEGVFAFPVAFEVPAGADDATKEQLAFLFGGVIYAVPGGLLGLRPIGAVGDRFDEDRVGLDHLSFAVAGEADLHQAASVFDELGVPHGDVKDLGVAWVLEFRDPDNIALELFAMKT